LDWLTYVTVTSRHTFLSEKIMSASIKTLVIDAIKAAETFGARIDAIRAALPQPVLLDAKRCANALREGVASHNGIKLAKRGESLVFPTDHANTVKARQQLSRLVKSVMGQVKPKKVEGIEVPAHIAKLAAQLAEACAQYEDSRKLASTAVAEAFAE
jgi:hypothetical protein